MVVPKTMQIRVVGIELPDKVHPTLIPLFLSSVLLKIWHKKNKLHPKANIQHSSCTCIILFPFIAYMCDNLYRKLETIFHYSVKVIIIVHLI